MSDLTYYAQKRDADEESLCRVQIGISSLIGGINFVDPVNTRKVHEDLMKNFEWDRFIPTKEKEFLDILKEMLNSQQQS